MRPVVIRRLVLFPVLFCSLGVSFSQAAVTSSITPDGTLGTTVTPTQTQAGKVYDINGGTIKGTNQFHSFGLFSIGTGDTASFSGPNTILNILSRVTGGQQSQIDGTIRVTIPGANLYIMNPAGVLFGPNASLDLSGSFHVTTADYLRLADSVQFLAKPDAAKDALLSTAPVAAFGFLSDSPAPIAIQQSGLTVSEGQTLSIIGGEITIVGDPVNGSLLAPGGVMNMASVASPGEVLLTTSGQPTLNVDSFAHLGTIDISQLAKIDSSSSIQGAGTVVIRGGQLTVDHSLVFSVTSDFDGRTPGIDIQVAGSFVMNDAIVATSSLGKGRSGDLAITANNILLQGGVIASGTFGSGRAGSVMVKAADALLIDGTASPNAFTGISSTAEPGSSGNAGAVTVSARTLILQSGGIISGTLASGRAGSVMVTVADTLLIDGTAANGLPGISSQALPGSSGDAGMITVSAHTLTLLGGGSISSATFGPGRAGSVMVTVADALLIDGTAAPDLLTGITSDVEPGSSGDAGAVTVAARTLTLQRGGVIASGTFGSGRAGSVMVTVADSLLIDGTTANAATGIDSNAGSGSSGDAGAVTVSARTLTIQGGGGISSDTFGSGHAGSVMVTVADALLIDGIAANGFTGIHSSAGGDSSGDAGQVSVSARALTLQAGSGISSDTFGPGRAGSVMVTVADALLINGTGTNVVTGITSNAGRGSSGDAGQVSVSAGTLTIQGGGEITSSTFGPGRAGSVMVTVADALLIDGTAAPNVFTGITSDAERGSSGDAGAITVTARTLTLQGGGVISNGTFGPGHAGSVMVTADAILIDGTGAVPSALTGISSSTEPGSSGDAGAITVSARTLTLHGGGTIESGTVATGRGGTFNIAVSDSLFISGTRSGLFTSSIGGSGQGGDIQVRAGNVTLADGATISASSTGTGNAGNILIQAGDFVARNSFVTTEALQGDGGNIELQIGRLVHLTRSDITTTVQGGAGNGGNISIDPNFVILDHSRIVANAFGGNGGNINITAGVFLVDPSSVLSASSALGVNGTIQIQSPVQNLSGSLSPLPASLLKIAPLTSQCAARAQGGSFSSFTVAGRDGLPAEPGGLLPSPLEQASVTLGPSPQASTSGDQGLPVSVLLSRNFEGRCRE